MIPHSLGNMGAGLVRHRSRMPRHRTAQVGIRFGLQGPAHAVATACATGSHAIGESALATVARTHCGRGRIPLRQSRRRRCESVAMQLPTQIQRRSWSAAAPMRASRQPWWRALPGHSLLHARVHSRLQGACTQHRPQRQPEGGVAAVRPAPVRLCHWRGCGRGRAGGGCGARQPDTHLSRRCTTR